MKKKILFAIGNMEIGGIQKSLCELLSNIHNKYDITLCCIKKTGHYLELLPDDIKVIDAGKLAATTEYPSNETKKFGFFCYAFRIFCTVWTKFFGKKFPYFLITKVFGKFLGEYDAAISFSQPINDKQIGIISNELILYGCRSKNKIGFIHCDFENYGGNSPYNRSLYKKFDKVACVSDSVGNVFKKCVPHAAHKTFTVYNTHNFEYIKKSASDNPEIYTGKPVVITVSRLAPEKGLIRCLDAFTKLRQTFPDIQWHIIGGGPEEKKLLREIEFHNLENTVILHGNQTNPYRFMKNADLFLLPSYHEASPMVFREAACLNLPVLTTDTLSAVEMIGNKNLGMVCSGNEICNSLLHMLTNIETYNINTDNICDNSIALKQFSELMVNNDGRN